MCLKETRFYLRSCVLLCLYHVSIRSSVQHHRCFSSFTPFFFPSYIFFKSSYLSNCTTSRPPVSLVSRCKRLAQAASCCQLITFLHADTFTVCLHRRHDANAAAAVPCSRASKCHVIFCAFYAHIHRQADTQTGPNNMFRCLLLKQLHTTTPMMHFITSTC